MLFSGERASIHLKVKGGWEPSVQQEPGTDIQHSVLELGQKWGVGV